jgi:hypothetical protein
MKPINKSQTLSTPGWQTDPDELEQLGMEDEAEAVRMEQKQRKRLIRQNNREDEREAARKKKRKSFLL